MYTTKDQVLPKAAGVLSMKKEKTKRRKTTGERSGEKDARMVKFEDNILETPGPRATYVDVVSLYFVS